MKPKKAETAYEFGDGSRLKTDIDAAAAVKELERIRKKHGVLTPRSVWEESRKPSAVFHAEFEWDEKKAAEAYRDDQARCVIRAVHILQGDVRPRAYVHVNTDRGSHYEPIQKAMRNADLRRQVLAEAQSYLAAARNKLAVYDSYMDLLGMVNATIEAVQARREGRAAELVGAGV